MKTLYKEVSRRMSHTNHRKTYNQTSICLEEVTMRVGHEVLVAAGNNSAQLVIIYQFFQRLPAFAFLTFPNLPNFY
jgi:hypothetical protein